MCYIYTHTHTMTSEVIRINQKCMSGDILIQNFKCKAFINARFFQLFIQKNIVFPLPSSFQIGGRLVYFTY